MADRTDEGNQVSTWHAAAISISRGLGQLTALPFLRSCLSERVLNSMTLDSEQHPVAAGGQMAQIALKLGTVTLRHLMLELRRCEFVFEKKRRKDTTADRV